MLCYPARYSPVSQRNVKVIEVLAVCFAEAKCAEWLGRENGVLILGYVLWGSRVIDEIARFYLRMVSKLDKDIGRFEI